MSDLFQQARRHIEKTLLERAAADPSFRALLVSDPHAALKAAFGTDPIPHLTIRVVEERENEAVLALPRAVASDELSDEILDLASGGFASPFGPDFSSICPPKTSLGKG